MRRVLEEIPGSHLAVAPQLFDDPEGMLDPVLYEIALSVERTIRTGKASAPRCLAMHPPYDASFIGPSSSVFVRVGTVAVGRLLVAMQTGRHYLGVMPRGGGGRHAVHPSFRIAAHVGLHAKVEGVALLRARHLRVTPALLVLRRRRRVDDRSVHDRTFAHHQAPLRQKALRLLKQRFGQAMGLQKVAELADRRLVGYAV